MNKIVLFFLSLALGPLYAANLAEVYQMALNNNATYLNAQATYEAAGYGVDISRANLLPSLTLAANTTANRTTPSNINGYYNSHGYLLTLTQPLVVVGNWYALSQAEVTYQQAKVTYAEALQTLITSVATDYFNVLEDQDQLQYALKNESYLGELLKQTNAQYQVGLKAYTDVQAAKAQYESAIATRVSAQNTLADDIEALAVIAGQPVSDLAPLEPNFPLIKPSPQDIDAWVNFALKNNLTLQAAHLASLISHKQIDIDAFGNGTTPTPNNPGSPGYLPTLSAVGTYQDNDSDNPNAGLNDNTPPNATIKTGTLQLNWNIFNGGLTYATVKADQYNYTASTYNEEATRRATVSNTREAYLNVLSDIAQIEALNQAVISGEASLKALEAGYFVGTQTIVDVLNQESLLFSSEQQYAKAIYSYIDDSLTLKENAGNLAPQDLSAINTWLVQKKV